MNKMSTIRTETGNTYALVALALPLRRQFHYSVPPHLAGQLQVGMRVLVPFGPSNRLELGYCVGFADKADVPRVKAIAEVVDEAPLINTQMLKLARWVSDYYLSSLGETLQALLPGGVRRGTVGRWLVHVKLRVPRQEAENLIAAYDRRRPKQADVLRILLDASDELTPTELAQAAGSSSAPIETLQRAGTVEFVREVRLSTLSTRPVPRVTPHVLNAEQAEAFTHIKQALDSGAYRPLLLFGVTSSGKTELYLQAIKQVVQRGKQAIVLVPEISLTPQTIHRFEERFEKVAALHSKLSPGERNQQWQAARRGEAEVIVGARSAVFAPVKNLGLIVIDEEHAHTFKQDTSPRYQAREVALKRAREARVPIILGSATPALESFREAIAGSYQLLTLTQRVESRPLPPVDIIDMREEVSSRRGFHPLSRRLEYLVRQAVARGEQVMLLLNRRGFSTYIHCRRCGYVLKCARCDITMTFHRQTQSTLCHYCHRRLAPPTSCPECGADTMRYLGMGTEKVEENLHQLCPAETIARMDSDSMRSKSAYARVLGAFRRGEIDILVGTQMIAKGLDFPNVTLVGVVSADSALNLPDFRASERTFQLLTQVAGRAGRGPKGGRVVIQTFNPGNYSIQCARTHDYVSFAREELRHRRELHYPPYSRLARILIEGAEPDGVARKARRLADMLQGPPQLENVEMLGPAPAPISVIRNKHRWHIVLKAANVKVLHQVLAPLSRELGRRKEQVIVDVDPSSLF